MKLISTGQNIHSWKRRLKEIREFSIVVLYLWLFINSDPVYAQKTLGTMMASRLISRSMKKFTADLNEPPRATGAGSGLSPIEVIALVQAMNSNKGGEGSGASLDVNMLRALKLNGNESSNRALRQSNSIQDVTDRQLPVPVPTPVPVPAPAAVVLAALLAFLTAVITGANPVQAVFIAMIAAFAAVLVALIALIAIIIIKKQKKNAPLIKKLVIKKTVLPIVVPIPIKKNEKKIIYKYHKKEPEHHHHHHEEYEYKKKKYKYKKMDAAPSERKETEPEMGHLSKLEPLLNEQDKLQSLVDNIIDSKKGDTALRRRAR